MASEIPSVPDKYRLTRKNKAAKNFEFERHFIILYSPPNKNHFVVIIYVIFYLSDFKEAVEKLKEEQRNKLVYITTISKINGMIINSTLKKIDKIIGEFK